MSWKTRKRGKPGQRGLRFKGKTLFFDPHYKYLAETVDFRSPTHAELAANQLVSMFNQARTRNKKRKIKWATVSAANRCNASAKSPKLSDARKQELKKMETIYREAYERMVLPPRA